MKKYKIPRPGLQLLDGPGNPSRVYGHGQEVKNRQKATRKKTKI
jgi:hypothetical protein